MSGAGPARQAALFARGGGTRVPLDPGGLEAAASAAMAPEAFAYLAGGAGAERTLAANRAAFRRWCIVPRMLRDVSRRDMSVELFGRRLPFPLLLAPIGALDLAHPLGERAVARAAAAAGIPLVVSSQASATLEECAAAGGAGPRWFQLYWGRSDAVAQSLVRRAERAGYGAVVLTVDNALLGWRPRDLAVGYLPYLRGHGIAHYASDPVFRAELAGSVRQAEGAGAGEDFAGAAIRHFAATFSRPSLAWDDLARLRGMTRLPLLLKGILHPGDALRAVEAGFDGVIVSNHGGRQLDGAVAALDALPSVAGAVDGRVPVLFDSGIRTGTDVVCALALGATAVLLGRPYVYGLALAGEEGVSEVIANLTAELDLALALSGCPAVTDLSRDLLVAHAGPSALH